MYFSNYADQRLYRQDPGGQPQPITPAHDLRYANAVMDERRRRLICVREDHTGSGEAINTIVALSLQPSSGGDVLVSGQDFYAYPRLSREWRSPGLAGLESPQHAVGRL